MNNIVKIILITVLSILALLTSIFLVLILTDKIDVSNLRFKALVSKNLIVDKEYNNTFTEIKIDSDAADVIIKEGNSDKIKVVVYGEQERTEVEDNSEILKISTTTKPCNSFCINTVISRIEITIPKEYQNKINIETKYGDIKVESAYDIKANTNYGDIKLGKANYYFDLETNYGDIKIDKVNISKDSSAYTNFGDVRVEETNEVYITAKTDLGDTKVNNNYKESNINLKLETNFGDVKVNN